MLNYFPTCTKIDEQKLQSKFNRVSWRKASDFMWTRISDPIIQRQLKILSLKGQSNVSDTKLNQVNFLENITIIHIILYNFLIFFKKKAHFRIYIFESRIIPNYK